MRFAHYLEILRIMMEVNWQSALPFINKCVKRKHESNAL